MSSMAKNLNTGLLPMPIFTAGGKSSTADPSSVWFEFTPFGQFGYKWDWYFFSCVFIVYSSFVTHPFGDF